MEKNFRPAIFKGSEKDSIRRIIYLKYIIFYRIDESRIGIARAVHGVSDLDALFNP